MINKLRVKLKTYWNHNVDSIGLDVFRIFYGFILVFEVSLFIYFKELILDKVPFIDSSGFGLKLLLVFWLFAALALFLGFQSRLASIINYLCSVLFFYYTKDFEYHMIWIYLSVNFILVFTPLGNNLLLYKVFSRKKVTIPKVITKVPILFYHSLIFWGIAVVYFDSFFRKLGSSMWVNGLGVWLPASVPPAINLDLSFILDQEFIIRFLGFFVLIFEGVLIFVFWFKPFRIFLFVIGIGFHLGILLAFPIPLFALGVCGIYLLLIPCSFWRKKIFRLVPSNELATPDFLNRKKLLISLLILFFLIPQFYITCQVGFLRHLTPNLFTENNRAYILRWTRILGHFTGVVPHSVFLDNHFRGYNHVIGLVAINGSREVWLPIVNEDGTPGYYQSGSNWANWSFRVNSASVKMNKLKRGIIRYTIFWAHKNNISLEDLQIEIRLKKIDIPNSWERSFLAKQMGRDWVTIGNLNFIHNKPKIIISEVESI